MTLFALISRMYVSICTVFACISFASSTSPCRTASISNSDFGMQFREKCCVKLDSSVLFTGHHSEMMSFKLLGLALALCSIPPVPAQLNSTAVGIEAVEAHFTQSGIVPAVLPKFTPTALLAVSFKGLGPIAIGQSISRERG